MEKFARYEISTVAYAFLFSLGDDRSVCSCGAVPDSFGAAWRQRSDPAYGWAVQDFRQLADPHGIVGLV